jgi:FtsH-binding integral membrane protein
MLLRGSPKSDEEKRWELLTWGVILISVAVIYAIAGRFNYLMLLVAGVILLLSTVYQDMREGWTVSWLTYALAILILGTGVAGVVNELAGGVVQIQWWVIVLVELGAVFIVKAFYDPLR